MNMAITTPDSVEWIPRIIKQGPDDESRYQIEHNAGFAHFIQEIDAYEDQDRNRKQQQIDLLAVKQRDHQNRPQVVRHGQGRQENFERNRHPIAEYRKDADGESNVRRRRDSPAGCRDGSRVERKNRSMQAPPYRPKPPTRAESPS